jgi:acetyl-CoA synthetase
MIKPLIEPSSLFKSQANIQEPEYKRLMEKFNTDPQDTWLDLAKDSLFWFKEPSKALEYKDKPFFTWFADGKTNISYNCIDRHLEKYGDKAAIIFEGELGDTKTLTYRELHEQVCKAANLLKSIGIKKGDHVAIYMGLCPEAIIAMQACLRIGAVHSVVFAGFSAHALRDRIEDQHARFVITADGSYRRGVIVELLATVREAIQDLDYIEKVLCFNRITEVNPSHDINSLKKEFGSKLVDWNLSTMSAECEAESLPAEHVSFVLYTSGSTGKPKGIVHTTAGYLLGTYLTTKWVFDIKNLPAKSHLLRYASPSPSSLTSKSTPVSRDSQALHLGAFQAGSEDAKNISSDVYWCTADIGWITGHSYVAYGPLANAATIFIYEGAPNHPHQGRFWELIEKYKINIFYTAPTAIRAFMQWGLEHVTKYDLSSLRLLGSVGEPINPAAWEWFYEHIGKSRCPIVDTWWQTETGSIAITTLPGIDSMKPGAAGLPLPGVSADINEDGLLYLASPIPSMARTIYGDDERYVQTYWSRIPGAYTAGDAATKDVDGYISISGRVDDVLNVSGHRLGTAEIESALVAHPMISEAAVVAVPHDLKGEGIVAFVVVVNGQRSKDLEEEFKNQVVKEIGAIAKPERVIICSGLPKTRSGKIMRRLLKDIAQGKAPSGDISTLENKAVLEELMNYDY